MNEQTRDIMTIETQAAPTPIPTPAQPSPDAMMALIERIATTPGVNLDALDRIVALRERVQANEARAAFTRDFAAMQPELPAIDAKGMIVVFSKADREKSGGPRADDTPQQSTPYALLADINEVIRQPLSDHGFALSFRTGLAGDGKLTVTGVLMHRDGHQEETTVTLMHDSSGSKNNVQAVGSSISYGRRYATLALLNITSRAPQDQKVDDDGRAAGAGETIGPDEIAYVHQLLRDTGSDIGKFLAFIKVGSVEAMTMADYKRAIDMLNRKKGSPK